MRNRVIQVVICLVLTTVSLSVFAPENPVQASTSSFAGGSGTQSDPYQIADVNDLQDVSNNLSAHYVLVNNVDASNTATWNWDGGKYLGFDPVGIFTGSFNGDGYRINGLYINRPSEANVGLFSEIQNGFIANLSISNCDITGDGYVGGLIGRAMGISPRNHIENVSVEGRITATASSICGGVIGATLNSDIVNASFNGDVDGINYVGGLIGKSDGSNIDLSHSNADVYGSLEYIGGFIGCNSDNSLINNSYSGGTSTGGVSSSKVGGFVGDNRARINNSYSTSITKGFNRVGGFIGSSGTGFEIYNCYSSGTVQGLAGHTYVGGFAGEMNETIIESSYTTGFVNATNDSGGFCGFYKNTHTPSEEYNDNIYNSETTGKTVSFGYKEGGTSPAHDVTTSDLMDTNIYWDFTNVWGVIVGKTYPYHRWQHTSPPKSVWGMAYGDLGITPAGGGVQIHLTLNDRTIASSSTGADGFFYCLLDNGAYEVDDVILMRIIDGSLRGNTIMIGKGDCLTDLQLYVNAVLAFGFPSDTMTVTTLSNAKGSLSDGTILYNITGDHLELSTGVSFLTNDQTTFIASGSFLVPGIIRFESNVAVSGDVTLTASEVTFNRGVEGYDGTHHLEVNGNCTVNGVIGGITPLGSFSVESSGTTTIKTTIYTTGIIRFGNSVILTGNVLLVASEVTFHRSVDSFGGPRHLEVNGNCNVNGIVGDIYPLASFSVAVPGLTNINNSIYTKGRQTFGHDVTMGDYCKLETDGGDITFGGTLNDGGGYHDLILNARTGDVHFQGDVGSIAPPAYVSIVSANNVVVDSLTTYYFVQSSGSGTTSIGTRLSADFAYIETNHVVGEVDVGQLFLDTNSAYLTGLVNGGTSATAIGILKTISVGTHFFNAFDLSFYPPDPSPPTNPTFCNDSDGVISGQWTSDNDPMFYWGVLNDSTFFLKGYYYYWGTSSNGTSSNSTYSTSFDPVALTETQIRYLRVQAWDFTGNTAAWETIFIYKYDGIPPDNPTICTDSDGVLNDQWTNDNDPAFTCSGASDTHSGLIGYYIYWGNSSTGTSTSYYETADYDPPPIESSQEMYLRMQTEDLVGNTASWQTIFTYKYDSESPASSVSVLAPRQLSLSYTVSWSGTDESGSGIASYDVQYKDGTGGSWTDLLLDTALTQTTFNGVDGHTYFFKSRARDMVGNVEDYPVSADGDTFTFIDMNDPPIILPGTFAEGLQGKEYSTDLDVDDPDPGDTHTWSISDSNAPWLSIDSTMGTLSGTPTTGGTYWVVVGLSDGMGGTDEINLSIMIKPDFDLDGLADEDDPDDDNDGTLDVKDDLPLDPTETVDTDGDGIGNNADTDDDNDGTSDTDDAFPLDPTEDTDTDDDGVGNNADDDDDDDGIPDVDDLNPLSPDLSDGDGGGITTSMVIIVLLIVGVIGGLMFFLKKGPSTGPPGEPAAEPLEGVELEHRS